jgi:adenylosuccinate lyase
VLLALVDKGLAREDAYKIVQRNTARSWDRNEDFRDLIKSDGEALASLSAEELDEVFDYRYYTRYVDHTFQRIGFLPAEGSA